MPEAGGTQRLNLALQGGGSHGALTWGVLDALLEDGGFDGEFQVASFHPDYRFAGSDPDDLANCTNRSPFPTLHLLREDSVERAVAAFPDPDAIVERNIETLERLGRERWDALLR